MAGRIWSAAWLHLISVLSRDDEHLGPPSRAGPWLSGQVWGSSWRHSRGKAVLASARPFTVAQHLLQQGSGRGWGLPFFLNLSPRKTQAINAGPATNSFSKTQRGWDWKVAASQMGRGPERGCDLAEVTQQVSGGAQASASLPRAFSGQKKNSHCLPGLHVPTPRAPHPERTPSAPCKSPGPE